MIEKAIQYLKKNVDQYEIFTEESTTETLEVNKDKLTFAKSNESQGIAFRVAIGKKKGFAYTNNLKDYKKAIEVAVSIAKMAPEDEKFESFAKGKKINMFNCVDKKTLNLEPKDYSEIIKDFINKIKFVDKDIVISEAGYEKAHTKYRIINSEGVDAETEALDNSFGAGISIKRKGKIESIEDQWAAWAPLKNMPAEEFAMRLIAQLDKEKIKNQTMQLILHPNALGSLLSNSMMFNCNADNVMLEKSLWKDMIGKQVFHKSISIKDDALTKDYMAARPFDDEGTPSRITNLIDKGVLKTFLHNSYTANHFKVESTGNAHRGVASLPSIGSNAIVFNTGKKNCIPETDNAIYVRDLLGVHTMNESTGDFSLGVLEGYKIENGEIKKAVAGTMIAGNILDLMKNVLVVGKKIELSLMGGGYYAPEILFPKIKVVS